MGKMTNAEKEVIHVQVQAWGSLGEGRADRQRLAFGRRMWPRALPVLLCDVRTCINALLYNSNIV